MFILVTFFISSSSTATALHKEQNMIETPFVAYSFRTILEQCKQKPYYLWNTSFNLGLIKKIDWLLATTLPWKAIRRLENNMWISKKSCVWSEHFEYCCCGRLSLPSLLPFSNLWLTLSRTFEKAKNEKWFAEIFFSFYKQSLQTHTPPYIFHPSCGKNHH